MRKLKNWWLGKWCFVKNVVGWNTITLSLFTIAFVAAIAILFAAAAQFYVDKQLSYSAMIGYICIGVTAVLALVASMWSAPKRWVARILIIAIWFFIVGMFADLVNQVQLMRLISSITG